MNSPTRRFLMQGIMWIILGGTVGLAELVTYHQHSRLDVTLAAGKDFGGVTVQLPDRWAITKSTDDLSPVLLTAKEPKGAADDEDGPRVLRIVRQPLAPAYQTPLEFAFGRFYGTGEAEMSNPKPLTIGGSPGVLIWQVRENTPTIQDLLSRSNQAPESKLICAATVAPSGRGLAVELEGPGIVEQSDLALVKKIAATISLKDEPATLDHSDISLSNGIRLSIPSDFQAFKQDDPLITAIYMRSQKPDVSQSIAALPITFLPKDGGATLQTMLSLYENDLFDTGLAKQDDSGVWRVDADATIQKVIPARAYAIAKDGVGMVAIFRGGENDQWIEPAWTSLQQSLNFPDESRVDEMVNAGTEAAKTLAETGLAKALPDNSDDIWWLACVDRPNRPIGWMHYQPLGNGGTIDADYWYEPIFSQAKFNWRGKDLKAYHVNIDDTVADTREEDSHKRTLSWTKSLKAGQVEILKQGERTPITRAAPPNYIPGAWLPFVLGKLSDQPVILRTDSFIDYPYARTSDLLTLTVRPQPDGPRAGSGAEGQSMHVVLVEFSGSGEKSRWYYRSDGTLDGVDYQQSQRTVRSEENDISMAFAHNEKMRPQSQ